MVAILQVLIEYWEKWKKLEDGIRLFVSPYNNKREKAD